MFTAFFPHELQYADNDHWAWYNAMSDDNPFKLHVGMDIEAYGEKYEMLISILKRAAQEGVISGFKYKPFADLPRALQLQLQQDKANDIPTEPTIRAFNHPFTIYLPLKWNEDAIAALCHEIEASLKEILPAPVETLSAADVPLTCHISMRCQTLGSGYVAVQNADNTQLNALRNRVLNSHIYKKIKVAVFEQELNHIKHAKEEIKASPILRKDIWEMLEVLFNRYVNNREDTVVTIFFRNDDLTSAKIGLCKALQYKLKVLSSRSKVNAEEIETLLKEYQSYNLALEELAKPSKALHQLFPEIKSQQDIKITSADRIKMLLARLGNLGLVNIDVDNSAKAENYVNKFESQLGSIVIKVINKDDKKSYKKIGLDTQFNLALAVVSLIYQDESDLAHDFARTIRGSII